MKTFLNKKNLLRFFSQFFLEKKITIEQLKRQRRRFRKLRIQFRELFRSQCAKLKNDESYLHRETLPYSHVSSLHTHTGLQISNNTLSPIC